MAGRADPLGIPFGTSVGVQNGLKPLAYLNYVIPKARLISADEQWDDLLPQRLDQETLNTALPSVMN